MTARDLIKRLDALKASQLTLHGKWLDCARYCMPSALNIGFLENKVEGTIPMEPVDVSGISASKRLASWLFSSTVYQGEEWFSLRKRGAIKNKNDIPAVEEDVKIFLERLSKEVLAIIQNSNFTQVFQEMLRSEVVFGTGIFYCEINKSNELVCRTFRVGDGVYIAENSKGMVDTVFREYELTARQAAQEFGYDKLSTDIRTCIDSQRDIDKKFSFLHAVFPREKYDSKKRCASQKKFASIYVEKGSNPHIVLNGGHDTFPYCVHRFDKLDGEVYGRAPAEEGLAIFKVINRATYAYVRALEFAADPMIFVQPEFIGKTDVNPGSINPFDPAQGQPIIYSGGGSPQSAKEFIDGKADVIGKIFYNDIFQFLEDRKNMSATEVKLRYDEMIQAIAPVVARLHTEFFKSFIERVALEVVSKDINNVCEQMPLGKDIEFEPVYTTRLDTKLKGILSANLINFLRMTSEFLVTISQTPKMNAYIDLDKVVDIFAETNNVLGEVKRNKDEIKKILNDELKQQQAAQMMEKIKPIDVQEAMQNPQVQQAVEQGGI